MVGPQPTGPSPGLPDAVRRHAPGLHRAAVMLAGNAFDADRLVTEAFRHAGGEAWSRELLLHALVRAFLRHAGAEHRDELDRTAGWSGADPGDVLASLRPRERAATVLTRVEGWPPRRAAGALHVRPGRVAALVRVDDGLLTALEAVADQHARPAHEVVTTVLAALPTTEDRTVTTGGTARVPSPGDHALVHRAWTWRWLAAAVVLGLVVWVTALGDTVVQDRDGLTADADADTGATTLALVDGTALSTAGRDLPERGWTLGADGSPPVDLEGLRLVEALPIDLDRPTDPLRVDTQPRSGAALFAVLWCDLPAVDANLQLPVARLGVAGESITLPCAGMTGEPPVGRLVPLPPAAGGGRTTASVSWSGDVPGRGRALLATYTEVGAGPHPQGADPTVPPVAGEGSVVLDGTSPAYQVRDRPVHHRRVRIGPDSTITAWAGGVGELTVQVDDVVVTDDGDVLGAGAVLGGDAGEGGCESAHPGGSQRAGERARGGVEDLTGPTSKAWRTADPELRDGRWLVYRPGRARTFAMPEAARPGTGERRVVTVAVTTTLDRRAWQVHVSGADTVEEDLTRVPLAGSHAPEWIGGHRLVAAWKVPNDGIPHPLVDPGLSPGRRFLLVDTPPGTELGFWGVVEPHVATTRGAAELTIVREVADAFDETVWRPGDQLVRTGASTSNVLRGTGTGVLAATVPAAAGQTAPSTLLAYQPVPYDDFDFASAPPMGVSVPVGEAAASFGPGTPVPGAVVVGRWTSEDLDEDGLLAIDTELTSRTWLRLTTEGRGRVQVLEGGRPAVWLPDGWWTSWTAEPVVTQVRVVGTRMAGIPGQPFQLRVEGYDEGFAVEVLARDGDGGAPGTT